ncbi:DET1 homolog isoform X3 [Phyllopteryx taeniolatus]|nr:DET1 homolog isoform X3 [Phyllopteryx taeniolatus]
MDEDTATLKPRRIQNQNVVHRLERRRICSGRPGAHWYRVRCLHQNLFPNFTVVNVEKPPCFLRKFSPDGRCFIAFSSDQTSLEIYEYQGCQAAQDLLRGQEGETLLTANDQRSLNIRGRLFERFFSLLHVTNVASNGEHLNRECSLFTDDCRYVIVGSAVYVPEEPQPYFFEVYRNNESVTPNPRSPLEDYSLHIIDLHTGRLCDTRSFKFDKIILSHNQGLYLYRNILAVLSVQQQTIHVFQVTPEGTFLDVRTIGRFCYEDDLLTLSAVCTEAQAETQSGFPRLYTDKTINSLKHRLLVYLWRKAEQDGSATAKRRFKDTIVNAKYGGHTEAVRRLLGQLPISAQSYSSSPYLDLSLFSYDDKWVSVMERPKTCGDHPIRFYARDSGLLKFKIQAGLLGRPFNHAVRRLVAFTFHPFEPFAISVQRTNAEYVVNFHMRHVYA